MCRLSIPLSCILHCIFTGSLEGSTRRDLSEEFIASIVERYEERDVYSIDQSIRGMSFYNGLEKKIRRLIYDNPSMTPNGSAMQPEAAADKSDEQRSMRPLELFTVLLVTTRERHFTSSEAQEGPWGKGWPMCCRINFFLTTCSSFGMLSSLFNVLVYLSVVFS